MPDETTREIPPALEPTGWESIANERLVGPPSIQQGAREHIKRSTKGVFALAAPEEMCVLMALANAALPDGDPRKITHEDAVRLYEEAEAIMNAQSDEYWDAEAVKRATFFRALGMKLESLLPPDVTTYTMLMPEE